MKIKLGRRGPSLRRVLCLLAKRCARNPNSPPPVRFFSFFFLMITRAVPAAAAVVVGGRTRVAGRGYKFRYIIFFYTRTVFKAAAAAMTINGGEMFFSSIRSVTKYN